jgi:hypothetical protein
MIFTSMAVRTLNLAVKFVSYMSAFRWKLLLLYSEQKALIFPSSLLCIKAYLNCAILNLKLGQDSFTRNLICRLYIKDLYSQTQACVVMKLDCTQSGLQKRNSISCTIDKASLWGGDRFHKTVKVDKASLLKRLRWHWLCRMLMFIIM